MTPEEQLHARRVASLIELQERLVWSAHGAISLEPHHFGYPLPPVSFFGKEPERIMAPETAWAIYTRTPNSSRVILIDFELDQIASNVERARVILETATKAHTLVNMGFAHPAALDDAVFLGSQPRAALELRLRETRGWSLQHKPSGRELSCMTLAQLYAERLYVETGRHLLRTDRTVRRKQP